MEAVDRGAPSRVLAGLASSRCWAGQHREEYDPDSTARRLHRPEGSS